MFTGLIERTGKIIRVQAMAAGKKFLIDPGAGFEAGPGESIALDGACFTVVERTGDHFWVTVSSESLARTTFGKKSAEGLLNIERALKLSDRLGGHLVLGHVDGVGKVKKISKGAEFVEMEIEAPQEVAQFLVAKGSVAVDGVSLTVNKLEGGMFSVMLIPETLKRTTLSARKTGDEVNLEADIIGKYVARLLKKGQETRGLTFEKLLEEGY